MTQKPTVHNNARLQALHAYANALDAANKAGMDQVLQVMRELSLNDLFFLLHHMFMRDDVNRDWIFARCREVQANPDGYLDLWARDSYKSSIITYALTIQEILRKPDITIGIFSHTRPIAKSFLRQIKREFEENPRLKAVFPDVLYMEPQKQSPKWSEDEGIVVRRKTNPKEATVEAWGLVDGQPIGKHFELMVYDDVVTLDSVNTPDMIKKTTMAWAMSRNLASGDNPRTRYIGTRYHFADTYRDIIERGAGKPRIYPATHDGTPTGKPVLLTQEALERKRKEMGPFVFGCLGEKTQILMADWSLKPIWAVKEGDMVVGWNMEPGKRTKVVPTRVLATQQHRADTVDIVMDGGIKITCTPDHRWWSGRRKEDRGRDVYRPAGLNYRGLSSLCRLIDLRENRWPGGDGPGAAQDAAYLAGMFDGEGTVSGTSLHISQSEKIHPEVCARIRDVLTSLEFTWGEHEAKGRNGVIDFYITGGTQEKFRFLSLCDPAKRSQIARSMFRIKGFCRNSREAIYSIKPSGRQMVYNLQTETGNYIANGYCSANCQMLQDPKADEVQGFQEVWLRYWEPKDWWGMNRYILVDPATEKKQGSDYTAIFVVGLGDDGNYYVIDMFRDRLSLTERARKLFELHREYDPLVVGYEKYGMQSDIEHFQDKMDRENYRFNIMALGGRIKKNDRIRKLIPLFEQGRIYIPKEVIRVNYEGRMVDMTRAFVEEEFKFFPAATHDDMLDSLARILDPDLGAIAPKSSGFRARSSSRSSAAMGYAPRQGGARSQSVRIKRRRSPANGYWS